MIVKSWVTYSTCVRKSAFPDICGLWVHLTPDLFSKVHVKRKGIFEWKKIAALSPRCQVLYLMFMVHEIFDQP